MQCWTVVVNAVWSYLVLLKGLEGSEERIILNGIQGTSELNSRRVNTQVSAVNMVTPRFEVNGALVVEHLNIAQQKVNLVDVKSK
jgi:hypothetical protein